MVFDGDAAGRRLDASSEEAQALREALYQIK
jgi:hypothetical protein